MASSRGYTNGRIYKILNYIDNEVYVGSTCTHLSKRMAWHRRDATRPKRQHVPLYAKMKEYGIENFSWKKTSESLMKLFKKAVADS